jgi:hypothetical protein
MSRFAVGIDLGTTNSALAYIPLKGAGDRPNIETFPVPQLIDVGEFGKKSLLPSFAYIPGEHELPEGATSLPWDPKPEYLVGEAAHRQGSRVPGWLVSSAKSWLCHAGVDRKANILPWSADAEVKRISPMAATTLYLKHLRDAWNHEMASEEPANKLEKQRVVLTVPASFDESARELTVEAAKEAGLAKLTLLEEPQAAFYDWMSREGVDNPLPPGATCVVVDCGGGTTDFSLIAVGEEKGETTFDRLAVGDHLLLGGDNMDVAIARHVEGIISPGRRLDAAQWGNLVMASRLAKEVALSPGAPDRLTMTVRGRGGKVIGQTLKCDVERTAIRSLTLDGFLPFVLYEDEPKTAQRSGLQEFGLPYVADAAITRHLGHFLRQHADAIKKAAKAEGADFIHPAAVLFNGGVFNAQACRDRVVAVMKTWFGVDWEGRVLDVGSYDLSVARGAAYSAWAKEAGATRIEGGAARSYYVGLAGDNPNKRSVLCVVPHGLKEGEQVRISEPDLELQLGEPVGFPLYSSTVRTKDKAGKVFTTKAGQLTEHPALTTTLRGGKRAGSKRIGVRLETTLTEIGTLELYLAAKTGVNRWRLHLQTRTPTASPTGEAPPTEQAPSEAWSEDDLAEAAEKIELAFPKPTRSKTATADPRDAVQLVKELEKLLELPRVEWPPGLLRGLWDTLKTVAERRGVTHDHEARWLNLTGFCLRPGWGDPLDAHRIEQVWKIVVGGPENPRNSRVWAEQWIFFRRIAGGLDANRQKELAKRLLPIVLPSGKKSSLPPVPQDMAECWRAAASLERLSVEQKVELGREALRLLSKPMPPQHLFWAITRLGTRAPLYGPINEVVPREEVGAWIEKLLTLPGHASNDAGFAVSQLARMCGDRARDIDDRLRDRVIDQLRADRAPERWIQGVAEVTELERAEQGKLLGDAVPPGLRLAT